MCVCVCVRALVPALRWRLCEFSRRPYTLHPTLYTLHPTPYTLHPTPYALGVGLRELCANTAVYRQYLQDLISVCCAYLHMRFDDVTYVYDDVTYAFISVCCAYLHITCTHVHAPTHLHMHSEYMGAPLTHASYIHGGQLCRLTHAH